MAGPLDLLNLLGIDPSLGHQPDNRINNTNDSIIPSHGGLDETIQEVQAPTRGGGGQRIQDVQRVQDAGQQGNTGAPSPIPVTSEPLAPLPDAPSSPSQLAPESFGTGGGAADAGVQAEQPPRGANAELGISPGGPLTGNEMEPSILNALISAFSQLFGGDGAGRSSRSAMDERLEGFPQVPPGPPLGALGPNPGILGHPSAVAGGPLAELIRSRLGRGNIAQ